LNGEPLAEATATYRAGDGYAASELRFVPSAEFDGGALRCEARSPALPKGSPGLAAEVRLTVNFSPKNVEVREIFERLFMNKS